jgi:hypothetical protein
MNGTGCLPVKLYIGDWADGVVSAKVVEQVAPRACLPTETNKQTKIK